MLCHLYHSLHYDACLCECKHAGVGTQLMKFFVCIGKVYQLADYHKSSCSFHFLSQKWLRCDSRGLEIRNCQTIASMVASTVP